MKIEIECATDGCGVRFYGNRDDGTVSEAEVRKMARKRGWLTVVETIGDGEPVVATHCPEHWPGDRHVQATGMNSLGGAVW